MKNINKVLMGVLVLIVLVGSGTVFAKTQFVRSNERRTFREREYNEDYRFKESYRNDNECQYYEDRFNNDEYADRTSFNRRDTRNIRDFDDYENNNCENYEENRNQRFHGGRHNRIREDRNSFRGRGSRFN